MVKIWVIELIAPKGKVCVVVMILTEKPPFHPLGLPIDLLSLLPP
jgi:hypothetical protein